MSTIKVNKIENTSTTAGGIEVDTSGHVAIDGQQLPTTGPLGNRNLIRNGGMQVAQRGTTGTSQNGSNNWVVDGFRGTISGQATITHSQESSGAPTGFQNWLKVTPSVADTSLASTDYGSVSQMVEGLDFAHVGYGTANAQTVTVSFQFKTNKAGTYCMIHRNGAGDRNYLHEFTPTADGNWQTITYTVPGDTTGTWEKTTNIGWRFELCIGNGTAFQSSTTGSWFSGSYYHSTPNQVNFLDSTSNELGITGVQVELGTKSTPFEHRSYSDVLQKCYRYYQRLGNERYVPVGVGVQGGSTSTASRIDINMRAPMRVGPTINYSNLILTDRSAFDNIVNSYSSLVSSETGVYASFFSANNGGANGRAILLTASFFGYLELNAEL